MDQSPSSSPEALYWPARTAPQPARRAAGQARPEMALVRIDGVLTEVPLCQMLDLPQGLLPHRLVRQAGTA